MIEVNRCCVGDGGNPVHSLHLSGPWASLTNTASLYLQGAERALSSDVLVRVGLTGSR